MFWNITLGGGASSKIRTKDLSCHKSKKSVIRPSPVHLTEMILSCITSNEIFFDERLDKMTWFPVFAVYLWRSYFFLAPLFGLLHFEVQAALDFSFCQVVKNDVWAIKLRACAARKDSRNDSMYACVGLGQFKMCRSNIINAQKVCKKWSLVSSGSQTGCAELLFVVF